MKLQCCAVFDSAAQCFNRPMFVQQAGIAVRSFSDEVNRPATDNVLFGHPEDFELHLIGVFDEESGLLESIQPTRCLVRGQDVSKATGA